MWENKAIILRWNCQIPCQSYINEIEADFKLCIYYPISLKTKEKSGFYFDL